MSNTLQDALDFLEAGKHSEALAVFEALIENPAWAAEALGHRAWHYFNARQYEIAVKDYERLRALSPHSRDAALDLTLAECHIELGDVKAAADLLASLIKRDPLNPQLLYLMLRLRNRSIDREAFLAKAALFTPNAVTPMISSNPRYSYAPIDGSIGLLLYSIIRNSAPDLVLETGSFVGLSAIYMAQALKDNGKGHLYCFDLFNLRLPNHLDEMKDQQAVIAEYVNIAGLSEFVSFFPGDSSVEIDKTDFKLDKDGRAVIFIDGDHTLKGAIKDFNAVAKYVNRNTIILYHDVNYLEIGWAGPALLASRLFGEGKFNQIILPTTDKSGVALIQSKDSKDLKAVRPTLMGLLAHKLYYILGLNKL